VRAIVSVALAGAFLVSTVGLTTAQQYNPAAPTAAPAARAATSAGTIALIDVSLVFDKHARFQAEMEAMKNEVKAYEQVLRTAQAELQAAMEKLKQYQPGSDLYKKGEEDLARKSNELKLQSALKRKEFLEREAEAYFRVYREVESVVGAFAQRNGITLVLRYSAQEINSKDRESVLRGINRPVVYRQPYLDITETILSHLNIAARPAVGPPNAGPGAINPGPARNPAAFPIPGSNR
jgi:Skp family chaperone for outer membrane proteins